MNHLQLTLINGLNETEIVGFKFLYVLNISKEITCIKYTIKAKTNFAADYFFKTNYKVCLCMRIQKLYRPLCFTLKMS